jgi:hypothetical protein
MLCQSVAESRGLTEEFEPDSAGSEAPGSNPNAEFYGMRWPANRLTYGQMKNLRQISKDVRLPITQLLKDAVDVYLMVLQREMQAIMVAESAGRSEISESDIPADEATSFDQQLVAESEAAVTPDENSPTG